MIHVCDGMTFGTQELWSACRDEHEECEPAHQGGSLMWMIALHRIQDRSEQALDHLWLTPREDSKMQRKCVETSVLVSPLISAFIHHRLRINMRALAGLRTSRSITMHCRYYRRNNRNFVS